MFKRNENIMRLYLDLIFEIKKLYNLFFRNLPLKYIKFYFNNNFYKFFYKLKPKYYEHFLKKLYEFETGNKLNFQTPFLFSEKIQWLKLNNSTELKTICSDKLKMRDFVSEKIGPEHVTKVYGVWDNFEDINPENLPQSFLLKMNHGSKMNIFIMNKDRFFKNKKAVKLAKKLINEWKKTNFAFKSLEMQYKNITPKIFAEEMLSTDKKKTVDEFQIHCFNGKPLYIEYMKEILKNTYENIFYDMNWQKQEFAHLKPQYSGEIPKPEFLDTMLEYAKKLSEPFKFVRVDFVYSNSTIYVLELTFTPCSGFIRFVPDKYDSIWGSLLNID